MVQNHMLQLLCLVAMEPPVALRKPTPSATRRCKVLRALRPIRRRRGGGQHGAGPVHRRLGAGPRGVPGYRQEEGVDPGSTTETYAALRVWIDNWRWAGVPFYLRAGKRLPKRVDRDRHPVQVGAAHPLQPRSRTPTCSPTC